METKNLSLEKMENLEGGLSNSAICSLALSGWGIMMGAGISMLTLGGGIAFAFAYTGGVTAFCDHYAE